VYNHLSLFHVHFTNVLFRFTFEIPPHIRQLKFSCPIRGGFPNVNMNQTERHWFKMGYELVQGKLPRSMNSYSMRIFRQHFGCSPLVIKKCWDLLGDDRSEQRHLLWALLFLKVYGKETTNAAICKCCDRTFRENVWRMIYALSDLESDVVSW